MLKLSPAIKAVIVFVSCMLLMVGTSLAATEFLTVYNPFTGKMDYYTLNASYVNCADIHGNTSDVCSPGGGPGGGEENLNPIGDYMKNNSVDVWVNASKVDEAITNKSYITMSQANLSITDKLKDANNSANNSINFANQNYLWWLNSINNSLNFNGQLASWWVNNINNSLNFASQTATWWYSKINTSAGQLDFENNKSVLNQANNSMIDKLKDHNSTTQNQSENLGGQNSAYYKALMNTSVDLKLFEYNNSIKSWTNGTITDKMKDSNNSANNSINFNNQNGAWWIAFVRTMENKNTTGWGIENNSVSYYLDWADINATIDERDEVGAPGSGEENLAPIGDYLNNNSASVWVNSSKILEQVTNQSYITIVTANASMTDKLKDHNGTTQNNSENFAGQNRLWWLNGINNSLNFNSQTAAYYLVLYNASMTDKLKDHNGTTQNNSENFAGQNRLWWLNGINNSLNFNSQTAAYYLVLYNASMTDKLKDHNGTTQNNSENLGGQNSVWWAAKINTSVDLKLFEYNKSIKDYINVSVDQKLFEYNNSIKGHINTSIDQKLFEYNKSIKDWTNKTIADKIKDVNNSINNTINFNQQSASWWLNGINNSLNFGSQTAAYYFSLYNTTYVKLNATNSGNINATGYNVTYVNCITFLSGGDIC